MNVGHVTGQLAVRRGWLPTSGRLILGTDPAHRGRGHGLARLTVNLAHINDEGMPAYLEASNPANVPLYERFGLREWTRFPVPDGGPEIVTMWRASSGRRQQPG